MKIRTLALALLLCALPASAAITLPYTFTAGGVIKASELNANFATIRDTFNAQLSLSSTPSADTISFNQQSVTPGSPASGVTKVYVKTDGRLYRLSSAGTESIVGGSGGGGSIAWNDEGPNSAVRSWESGNLVHLFPPATSASSTIQAAIKVSSGYTPGNPMTLNISYYSPSSSNTILLKCTAYLVRKNQDPITSTTNSRLSTNNTAFTNTSTNMIRADSCDLTDSTGKINSVSVSTGDIIKVVISRGTDTDTADVRFLDYGSELVF